MSARLDIREFRRIFREYYNPLTNFASRLIGEKEAEDAVQEVFVYIWEKRKQVLLDSPKSFLFASVYNKCLEIIRKKKIEAKYVNEFAKLKADTDLIKETADIFMLKEKINNSLRQLPPKCREVFVLSKLNGLTYAEIAEELNISVKTVEYHMITALRKLRKLLSDTL